MSAGDNFHGATLRVTEVPVEKELATRCIARLARDAADEALLMDAVFGGRRTARRPKGTVGKKVPHRRTYQYPCPVGPEGYAYRSKVRAWAVEEGLTFHDRGSLEGWLLTAYVQSTGDVWDPQKKEVGAS